jgi:hypothetical protein
MYCGRLRVLLKLSQQIRECHRHATEARRRAEIASDPYERAEFFDTERRWLFLAHGYEFSERVSRFTGRQVNKHRAMRRSARGA